MSVTKAEIEENFNAFTELWKRELPASIAELDKSASIFGTSYARIVSLNAWRAALLAGRLSAASVEFFSEAVNDVLVSHVFARMGTWRTALMSLRGAIENVCYCLFYKDHPVELRLWETGKHRPAFSDVHGYLQQHPDVAPLGNTPVTGLAGLKA